MAASFRELNQWFTGQLPQQDTVPAVAYPAACGNTKMGPPTNCEQLLVAFQHGKVFRRIQMAVFIAVGIVVTALGNGEHMMEK
jgi:hypothetical protein